MGHRIGDKVRVTHLRTVYHLSRNVLAQVKRYLASVRDDLESSRTQVPSSPGRTKLERWVDERKEGLRFRVLGFKAPTPVMTRRLVLDPPLWIKVQCQAKARNGNVAMITLKAIQKGGTWNLTEASIVTGS